MSIKLVLFDLDGTLLPMDQDTFTGRYFKLLAKKLLPHGYDPEKLIQALWMGVRAMVKNDGSCVNEEAFWNCFASILGESVRRDLPVFDDFYHNEFSGVQEVCGFNPQATQAVSEIKAMGLRVALATNPLFPAIATQQRICWAGLKPEDFELYTTYENSTRCKPNPDYYRDILRQLGVDAGDCLMVGNDVEEDMIAASSIGMQVFLLSDCLLNRKEHDASIYPQGSFDALMNFIRAQS